MLNVAPLEADERRPAGPARRVRLLRRRSPSPGPPARAVWTSCRVPDNYYADLQARFGLDDDGSSELSELDLLYDRDGAGEFVHFYTRTFGNVFFEVVERARRLRRLRRAERPGSPGLPALESEDDHERNTLMSDEEAFSEHELVTGSDTAQRSQGEMDAEMAAVIDGYEAGKAEHGEETQPRLNYPPYRAACCAIPPRIPHPCRPGDDRALRAGLRASRR